MRVIPILSDFIRWRWAPVLGLVGASLFYVLLAVLLIPSQVGAQEPEEEASTLESPERPSDGADETSETDAEAAATNPVKHIERSSPLSPQSVPKRRGFSPPLERPDPAPPPPPAAPPPPPAPEAQAVAVPVPPPPAPPAAVLEPPVHDAEQRLPAAAAARAATLAATRGSRLAGRGLRPRARDQREAAPAPDEGDEESGEEESNVEEDEADTGDEAAEENNSETNDDQEQGDEEAEEPEAEE